MKVYDLAMQLGLTVICQASVEAVVAVFVLAPMELMISVLLPLMSN